MALIQPESEPFERLDEARAAALAVRLAELMRVYRRPAGARLDRRTVDELADAVANAGIGQSVAVAGRFRGTGRTRLSSAVLAALEASPLPRAEIPALAELFGLERLSALTGAAVPSLRRYAAGERTTPDPVAHRIHFLARVVAILEGSYNEFGVRRWFDRPRAKLDGRAPADLLTGDWDPDDRGPRRVRRLAETLLT